MENQVFSLLSRIEDKLDENTAQTIENTISLQEHMRRTAILEEQHAQLSSRIKPLEAHAQMWAGAGKVITIAGLIAGIATGLAKLFI